MRREIVASSSQPSVTDVPVFVDRVIHSAPPQQHWDNSIDERTFDRTFGVFGNDRMRSDRSASVRHYHLHLDRSPNGLILISYFGNHAIGEQLRLCQSQLLWPNR